jgi:hypothetical protein
MEIGGMKNFCDVRATAKKNMRGDEKKVKKKGEKKKKCF